MVRKERAFERRPKGASITESRKTVGGVAAKGREGEAGRQFLQTRKTSGIVAKFLTHCSPFPLDLLLQRS